jgi:hypothetical protein
MAACMITYLKRPEPNNVNRDTVEPETQLQIISNKVGATSNNGRKDKQQLVACMSTLINTDCVMTGLLGLPCPS